MNPYDVTSSFVRIVDADPQQAREVLTRIDPMRSLADRLSALGLDDRTMWANGDDELTYRLVWRFGDDRGSAMLDWRLTFDRDAAGRTVLNVKLAGRGSDAAARARVLSSWMLLEELAENHTRRLARTVDEFVNADDYEHDLAADPPQLLRVV